MTHVAPSPTAIPPGPAGNASGVDPTIRRRTRSTSVTVPFSVTDQSEPSARTSPPGCSLMTVPLSGISARTWCRSGPAITSAPACRRTDRRLSSLHRREQYAGRGCKRRRVRTAAIRSRVDSDEPPGAGSARPAPGGRPGSSSERPGVPRAGRRQARCRAPPRAAGERGHTHAARPPVGHSRRVQASAARGGARAAAPTRHAASSSSTRPATHRA